MTRHFVSAAVFWLVIGAASAAHAQVFVGKARPRAGSAELSGGGFWGAGQSLSDRAATLTANPGSGSSGFDLFTAEPKLDPSLGVQGALAVYITPSLAVEGGIRLSRPKVKVNLTNDAENAADVTASTTLTSYVFTGSLVYHFGTSGRTIPFVSGGAGHIRDVHSGNELVETGTEYHGTLGFKSWFGRERRLGFRAEGGITVRDGGFTLEDEGRRTAPMASASLLYLF